MQFRCHANNIVIIEPGLHFDDVKNIIFRISILAIEKIAYILQRIRQQINEENKVCSTQVPIEKTNKKNSTEMS